jgi:hypothetical protein
MLYKSSTLVLLFVLAQRLPWLPNSWAGSQQHSAAPRAQKTPVAEMHANYDGRHYTVEMGLAHKIEERWNVPKEQNVVKWIRYKSQAGCVSCACM